MPYRSPPTLTLERPAIGLPCSSCGAVLVAESVRFCRPSKCPSCLAVELHALDDEPHTESVLNRKARIVAALLGRDRAPTSIEDEPSLTWTKG